MSNPAIVYACVCRSTEVTVETGNKDPLKNTVKAFIEGTVSGAQSEKSKGSFNHGPYSYNFLKDRGFTFVAIGRKEVELRVIFGFLKEMQDMFNAGSDKTRFKRELDGLLAQYSNAEDVDKVKKLAAELEEVKDIMRQNLENMVKRADQLAQLDESVVQLEADAGKFKVRATEVKKVVWWRDLRCKIILGVALIIVIFVIVVIACGGFDFKNCKSSSPA